MFVSVKLQQTYNKAMIIPNKTLKIWEDLKEEGDIAELAKETGKSEGTIYRIFRDGIATVEDAERINAFYKNRKKRISKIKIEEDDNN